MRTTLRIPTLFAALTAAALFGACGDDDGDDDDDDDDVIADAAIDSAGDDDDDIDAAIDAPPAVATMVGTVAITEITLSNNVGLGENGLSGAAVQATFTDLTTVTVQPVVGTGAIGECTVFVYNVEDGDTEPTVTGQGTLTITNAESPIGSCVFNPATGYVCVNQAGAFGATAGVLANTPQAGLATATAGTGVTFTSGADLAGMHVNIAGSDNAANNGTFPIVGASAGTVTYANPFAVNDAELEGATFTLIAGAGPGPANREFLGDDTEVNVVKTAGDVLEAFDEDAHAAANGMTLAAAGDDCSPEADPGTVECSTPNTVAFDDSVDIVFSCDAAHGGDCGDDPPAGQIVGLAISGRTTDAVVSPANPTAMPPPVTSFATFQCSVIGEESIALTTEAMTAILGTNPTRIQTQVIRSAVKFVESDANELNVSRILVGHGFVGFSDLPD